MTKQALPSVSVCQDLRNAVQELGKRSDVGDVPVTLPDKFDMSAVEIYAFALNRKRKDASLTVYLST